PRTEQSDPPSLQRGTGGHHDTTSFEALVGRWVGTTLSIPSPRRWRGADVLRNHRSGSRDTSRPRPRNGTRGAPSGRAAWSFLGYAAEMGAAVASGASRCARARLGAGSGARGGRHVADIAWGCGVGAVSATTFDCRGPHGA